MVVVGGQASFAALCGASLIPASSGKTTRHRLNRGVEGSSENATVATAPLADLVGRGLDVERDVVCVLDGRKANLRP